MTTRSPAEERAIELYCARVYLREAAARRARDPHFSSILRGWAASARRRAAAIDVSPPQADMFA